MTTPRGDFEAPGVDSILDLEWDSGLEYATGTGALSKKPVRPQLGFLRLYPDGTIACDPDDDYYAGGLTVDKARELYEALGEIFNKPAPLTVEQQRNLDDWTVTGAQASYNDVEVSAEPDGLEVSVFCNACSDFSGGTVPWQVVDDVRKAGT